MTDNFSPQAAGDSKAAAVKTDPLFVNLDLFGWLQEVVVAPDVLAATGDDALASALRGAMTEKVGERLAKYPGEFMIYTQISFQENGYNAPPDSCVFLSSASNDFLAGYVTWMGPKGYLGGVGANHAITCTVACFRGGQSFTVDGLDRDGFRYGVVEKVLKSQAAVNAEKDQEAVCAAVRDGITQEMQSRLPGYQVFTHVGLTSDVDYTDWHWPDQFLASNAGDLHAGYVATGVGQAALGGANEMYEFGVSVAFWK